MLKGGFENDSASSSRAGARSGTTGNPEASTVSKQNTTPTSLCACFSSLSSLEHRGLHFKGGGRGLRDAKLPTQPLSRALSGDIYSLAAAFVQSMLPAINELILLERRVCARLTVRVASATMAVPMSIFVAFHDAVPAIALMERSTHVNCSRAGLRMLVAMFNHQLEKDGWTHYV